MDEEDLAAVQRCPDCFSELRPGADRCLSCGSAVPGGGGGGGGATAPTRVRGRTSSSPGLSPIPTVQSASSSAAASPDVPLPSVSAAPQPTLPRRASVDDEVIGEEEMAKILQVCQDIQNTLVFPHHGKGSVAPIDLTKPPRRFLCKGELEKKGTVKLIKRNNRRELFLFKDLIVVTHLPDIRGKRKVSAVLNLPICELRDPFFENGADVCSFEVIDPSSRSVTFVAKDTKEKRHWLYEIAEAILAHMDPYETGAHVGFIHTLIQGSVFEAAVRGKREKMARYLTHRMCEPNQKDRSGRCPIHYVVELEHVDVLRIMLLAGKSGKNVDLSAVDGEGRRALDIAIDKLSVELLEEFFRAGMGVIRSSLERAMLVFAALSEVTERELDFMDVLFTRAGRNMVRKNLIEEGTLLHKVAEYTGPSVDKLVVYLMKRGCDPNAARPADGERPLHVAGLTCNVTVARELLRAGAQPNAKESMGNSVLHLMYNLKGTPPHKFPSLDVLLDQEDNAPRQRTALEVVKHGGRLDIPNDAGVTCAGGINDKITKMLKAGLDFWKAASEPASGPKWSKMFPCEPHTRWADEDGLPECQLCSRKFDIMRPKKRCQFCSRLVCPDCSRKKFSLLIDGRLAPRRVDDGCFNFLCNRSTALDNDPELVKRMQAKWGEQHKEDVKRAREDFVNHMDAVKKAQDSQWAKSQKKRGIFDIKPRTNRTQSDATAVFNRGGAGARRHTTLERPVGRPARATSDFSARARASSDARK